MIKKAMILAAGYGKRLLPLTEKKPKSLIKIGDKSLIQRNIEHLINNGFNEIIINVSLGIIISNSSIYKYPVISNFFRAII